MVRFDDGVIVHEREVVLNGSVNNYSVLCQQAQHRFQEFDLSRCVTKESTEKSTLMANIRIIIIIHSLDR